MTLFSKSSYQQAIVLEDDIMSNKIFDVEKFPTVLSATIRAANKSDSSVSAMSASALAVASKHKLDSPDLIYLGFCYENEYCNKDDQNYESRMFVEVQRGQCTHAILYSRQFAQRFLRAWYPKRISATDSHFREVACRLGARTRRLKRALFTQKGIPSMIGNPRVDAEFSGNSIALYCTYYCMYDSFDLDIAIDGFTLESTPAQGTDYMTPHFCFTDSTRAYHSYVL
jgi:hypothetical protein